MPPTLAGPTPMLHAEDLTETRRFYERVLGFQLAACWPRDDPTWIALERDGARLMFTSDGDVGPAALTGVLYFDATDVRGLHDRVRGKAKVLWGPEVYHYGRLEFAITDPNGYRLSFGEETDEEFTQAR